MFLATRGVSGTTVTSGLAGESSRSYKNKMNSTTFQSKCRSMTVSFTFKVDKFHVKSRFR